MISNNVYAGMPEPGTEPQGGTSPLQFQGLPDSPLKNKACRDAGAWNRTAGGHIPPSVSVSS